MKDAATIEEVQDRIAAEFGGIFPRYQSLEAIPEKGKKGKKDV